MKFKKAKLKDKVSINKNKGKVDKKVKKRKKKIKDSTLKLIPYEKLLENDITYLGKNQYSKTYVFEDVNYNLLSVEEKSKFLESYSKILNTFENNFDKVQISLVNEQLDKEEYIKALTERKVDNGLDAIAEKYKRVIVQRIEESRNFKLIKTKHYIVTTITEPTFDKAKNRFRNIEFDLISSFKSLNKSKVSVVTNFEKTRLLSNIYRDKPYWHKDKARMDFEYDFMEEKTFIASNYMKFNQSSIESDGKILKSYVISNLPSSVSDQFVQEILSIQSELIFTMNIEPIKSGKAQQIINSKLTGLKSNKVTKQQRAWRENFDDEIITEDINEHIKSTKEYSNDLIKFDQKLFKINIIITLISDEENINTYSEQLENICSKYLFGLSVANYNQQNAFSSCLPVGNCTIPIARYMNTNSIAGFVPFDIKTMLDLEGFSYGKDIRDNIVMLNRKKLDNYNGFILGSPGKGKSFSAKEEILHTVINTLDHVLIIDPEREYSYLVELLGGETIHISNNTNNIINIMDIYEHYDGGTGDGFVKAKSDFLLTVFEVLIGGEYGLEPAERSIIDRHIRKVYQKYVETKNKDDIPILEDLYNSLMSEDKNKEIAQSIGLSLELYVKGSLSMFNGKTNVDINNRIVNFDIKELGQSLQTLGLLVITDFIWRRVFENRLAGNSTWIFIDEIHLLFKNKHTLENLESVYKRFRKYAGFPTGITQNISDLLTTKEGETMLSNSEFIKILSQSKTNRNTLVKLFSLNEMQEKYITEAEKGVGLLKFGESIIPINNTLPENAELFEYFTTNPYKDDNIA